MGKRREWQLLLALTIAAGVGLTPPAAAPSAAESTVLGVSDWPYPEDWVDPRAPSNGCGPQGTADFVQDEIGGKWFTPACNWHDRCYSTKGMTQQYCDEGMGMKMLDICDGDARCRATAKFYFIGISIGGGFGPYPDGQRWACERTPHRNGRVFGDPHFATFDGRAFSLMSAGEFSLVRDGAGDDLVQVRLFPAGAAWSVVSGVAVRLGEREVVAQLDLAGDTSRVRMYLDGQELTGRFAGVEEGTVELGAKIQGANQLLTIRARDGFRVQAIVFDDRIELSLMVMEPMFGAVSGLLGNADGSYENDLVGPDGPVAYREDVQREEFVARWRVAPAGSMFIPDPSGFDYHGAEALAGPDEMLWLTSFDALQVDAAETQCQAAGLHGFELDACTFDVLASGDPTYAVTAGISARHAAESNHPDGVAHHQIHWLPVKPTDGLIPASPLVEAILRRDVAAVAELLTGGADANAASARNQLLPLTAAALVRDVELTRLLLDAGADPNASSSDGSVSALHAAADAGAAEVVSLLLEAGADPNFAATGSALETHSPLHAGAAHPDVVRLLIAAGADPDGRNPQHTPLHLAADHGAVDSIELLLAAGADVDAGRGSAAGTPLVLAVMAGRTAAVEVLVAAGADTSVTFAGIPLFQLTQDSEILRLLGG